MMEQAELLVSRHGRLGRIRLNRPKALNSLTLRMVRLFTQALMDFGKDPQIVAVLVTGEGERGLCAGGDIRALYELRNGDKSYYKTFWREEYELNALIAAFRKPYVVLMDGLVMGGGVGISAHGNHRIVTERTRLAMPETGIGFIPDVGGTWLLSRAGGAGLYMALSGAAVSGSDAVSLGLADILIESDGLTELVGRLLCVSDESEVSSALADLSRPPEKSVLMKERSALDDAAARHGVEEILNEMEASASAFLRAAAAEIRHKSPTSVKVTYALLQRASRARGLEECLLNEYRAACRLLKSHDLYEGIRAAVIDKDRAPKWAPATLDEVTDSMVRSILAGDGAPEPVFRGGS
ncbi:MAG: enoyl-CoA hydratase/isomerase family protein [Hyphomicrobiales bacterium]|nr:MAG: enoyl-CoA hydratase/isomerase family protein [Hyphomicrobiales bacterium]